MDRKLLLILFFAALLRLGPLLAILSGANTGALYQNDSDEYIAMGRAVAEGNFVFAGMWQPLFRTPGYPLFLSLFYAFGLPDGVIAAGQVLLDVLSCLLIFHLALRVLPGRDAAYAASALFAMNPLFIAYSFQLLSETLFLSVFLLANVIFFDALGKKSFGPGDSALLGAGLGFLIWIRPAALLFPLIYASVLYARERSLKSAAVLLAVPALFALAWMARNYAMEGEFALSGTALWNIVCYYAGAVANDQSSSLEGHGHAIWEYRLWDPPSCTELPYERLKEGLGAAVSLIGDNLPVFARHMIIGWALLFDPFNPAGHIAGAVSGIPSHEIERLVLSGGEGSLWFLPAYALALAYQLAVYGFALRHIWDGKAGKDPLFILFVLLLAYTLIINGPLNYARYRFPIEPFLIIFAAAGIAEAKELCRRCLSSPESARSRPKSRMSWPGP